MIFGKRSTFSAKEWTIHGSMSTTSLKWFLRPEILTLLDVQAAVSVSDRPPFYVIAHTST